MDNIPVQQISELLDEVSNKVPKLITGLMDSLYSADAGKKIGQGIGNLYKELIANDIPQEVAITMCRDYMVSLKDMVGKTSNVTFGKDENAKQE